MLTNKWKWISFGVVGSLFAVSHLGMIGYIATRDKEAPLPSVDLPVGPYTSYKVSVSDEGYAISYKANDPKTAYITKDIKEKGGFLGLATETTKVAEEYFMDGQINQGGAVSNARSWIDQPPGLTGAQAQAITDARKSEACIKAIGSAEGTGRLVGTSIGAAAAPTLVPTSLPVPSADPIALIHASLCLAATISAVCPAVKPGLPSNHDL